MEASELLYFRLFKSQLAVIKYITSRQGAIWCDESEQNLITLCTNCHRLVHRKTVRQLIEPMADRTIGEYRPEGADKPSGKMLGKDSWLG